MTNIKSLEVGLRFNYIKSETNFLSNGFEKLIKLTSLTLNFQHNKV